MYGIHARWGGAGWHGGVPLNLDAVFEFDGSTIFAKKDLYYRYNDYIHKVKYSWIVKINQAIILNLAMNIAL